MARKRIQRKTLTIDEKIVNSLMALKEIGVIEAWSEHKRTMMFKELPV